MTNIADHLKDKYNPIFEMFVGRGTTDEQDLTNLIAAVLVLRRAGVDFLELLEKAKPHQTSP